MSEPGEKSKIVICDDDPRRVEEWAGMIRSIAELSDKFDVIPLEPSRFASAAEALSLRRVKARRPPSDMAEAVGPAEPDEANIFDLADVLVLDYDLTPHPSDDEDLPEASALQVRTGASIAYLARCYSTCGFIVVVNHYHSRSTFDLTMRRSMDSYADLDVSDEDLARRSLWLGGTNEPDSFRPSHWPILSEATSNFERRVQQVALEASVLAILGFNERDESALTRRQLEVLSENSEPRSITFDQLVSEPEVGLRGRDVQPLRFHRERIAASVVGRWLDNIVLPAQNVIIDSMHLRDFYPHLVTEGFSTGSGDVSESAHQLSPRRPASKWFTQPTYSHVDVREIVSESRLANNPPREVFCEDTSRFRLLIDVDEIETDVAGPYSQRFIEHLKPIEYRPVNRLLT